MKHDLSIALRVTTEALEQQQHESDPSSGVNGHLYFLVKAIAEARLTKPEQEQIQRILALHKQCTYASRSKRLSIQ